MKKEILILIFCLSSLLLYYKLIPLGIYFALVSIIISIFAYSDFDTKRVLAKKGDLFNLIDQNNLELFSKLIKDNKISVLSLNQMKTGNTSLFIYSMEKDAFEIFKHLISLGIDVNYSDGKLHPPIIYAAHHYKKKYMAELVNHPKINLNATHLQFRVNALEIAVWRARCSIAEILLKKGMKFSIDHYNSTVIGRKILPFDQVDIKIKKLLLQECIFDIKKQEFNIHDKTQKKIISLGILSKRYIAENFLLTA